VHIAGHLPVERIVLAACVFLLQSIEFVNHYCFAGVDEHDDDGDVFW
jgi:hypothetical protein